MHGADDSQWVLRGNHHDAWVNGADDPIAGMAPMMEEARMLGELHKQGMDAEAYNHLLRVGWGRAGAAGVRGVG